MWQIEQSRQGETFIAHFLTPRTPGGVVAIGIVRPVEGSPAVWEGFAAFPWAAREVAFSRFLELHTDIDVENVMREWGDPRGAEVQSFIAFIGHEQRAHGLGEAVMGEIVDDLPDLILPADLVRHRGPVKARRARKAKEPAAKAPYVPRSFPKPAEAEPDDVKLLPLDAYDHIIVSFSGGKDSVAAYLYLLELGVRPERIELWHQAVDGRPHVATRLWDWPCTEGYCEAFAQAFGSRLLYQWKDKGFLGELLRRNEPTASTTFQLPNGREVTTGGGGDPGTRLVFPAMAADLMTRWCSAYLKIDVAKKVFTNDPRFQNKRSLIVTGERREESGNRAKYATATDYGSTQSRTVHQWRAVLPWFEEDVWRIMEQYRVRPHPAYFLGWSRVSCLPCIFGNPDQWATVREAAPAVFQRLAMLEQKFYIASQQLPNHPWSLANQRRRYETSEAKASAQPDYEPKEFKPKAFDGYLRAGQSLTEAADQGTSYLTPDMTPWLELGLSEGYPPELLLLRPDEGWVLPVGAGKHSGGPT